ncbi:MupA/Atu3671 family FMN-dependent luciferase-like monooxygenase [Actinophytocola xanthii]|uniref:Peptide synthetase n=1 Tax=Actinophytocola xanthii TaxID=1912961 RepID=A0A1Q8CK47_9PSEU|nr:MupA/Atu3671 family FMN-dependent luciferase-like monooxygenase [Actinophytocola xanthii]OLF14716.1 peptide synthetase [Actinophytocola xanthii]
MSGNNSATTTTSALDGLDPSRRALIEHALRNRAGSAGSPPAGAQEGAGGGRGLKISVFFFSADVEDDPRDKHALVLDCAELADELGLHAIWVPERHFDPFGAPYPSPGLLLAAVAARTKRIALRSGSVVLPLRDPLLVAEEWGVLDSLSNGRMGMSLASGWHADDFVLNPDGFDSRKTVLEERLADLRTLWSGGSVRRPGPGDRVVEVRTYPRPRHAPPIWLTSAKNPSTWQAAGRLGLHVLTAMLEQSLDEIARNAESYRAALNQSGQSIEDREVTCMLHTHLAADAAEARSRVREPLRRYLSAHLNLFEKFAASQNIGVRPEDVSDADRQALVEHGLRRYIDNSGLFGSVESCQPVVDRLRAAGVTELGCLVDFGLPREQVLDSVRELARLNASLRDRGAGDP